MLIDRETGERLVLARVDGDGRNVAVGCYELGDYDGLPLTTALRQFLQGKHIGNLQLLAGDGKFGQTITPQTETIWDCCNAFKAQAVMLSAATILASMPASHLVPASEIHAVIEKLHNIASTLEIETERILANNHVPASD